MRVLIAEDHHAVRRCVRDIIEAQCGAEVCAETGHGSHVLALAAEKQPDIAVIDLSLPGMGGLALTQQLMSAAPMVKVLILTMTDDDDMVAQCLGAGARGYLLKTDAEQHLPAAIAALASNRTYLSPHL